MNHINKNIQTSTDKLTAIDNEKIIVTKTIADKEKEKVTVNKQIQEAQTNIERISKDEIDIQEKYVMLTYSCMLLLY